MEEKVAALVGGVAVVALAGRGMRPLAKLGMRGVVTASDTVTGAVHGVTALYAEVRQEREGGSAASTGSMTKAETPASTAMTQEVAGLAVPMPAGIETQPPVSPPPFSDETTS